MRNYFKQLSWTCCILPMMLSVCIITVAQNERSSSIDAQSLQAKVEAFYKWYLRALREHRDPLTDERPTLQKYVTKELIATIERKINSPDGLDVDYFIQAQDYFDEWESNISVTEPLINHALATVIVKLGSKDDNAHRLKVSLVKTASVWKIRRVQEISDGKAPGSQRRKR